MRIVPITAVSARPGAPDAARAGLRFGLSYGLLAAPMAFAALPLYVLLPNHYASALGVPLAALGAVLLATRSLDALIDPWLGQWADRLLGGPRTPVLRWAALAAALLAVGFAALFLPPVSKTPALLAWCALALVLTYAGYSALGVLHQAWGARLGGGAAAQARIVGWREGLGLAGVVSASVLPALVGLPGLVGLCAAGLGAGIWALARAPYPASVPRPIPQASPGRSARPSLGPAADAWLPWRQSAFRRLLAVYLLNGVASAVPATLVLFFVRDRLQLPTWAPLFLGAYFVAGALSVAPWVRAVARFGLVNCWLAGMLLAVAGFAGAARLGAGDGLAFLAVCLASGAALGADLAVPAALLTGVLQRAGHALRHEGRYFGWWSCATKLSLALAAGIALPLLQALGYRPGQSDTAGMAALVLAYAALPCLLKLGAAALLWSQRHHLEPR